VCSKKHSYVERVASECIYQALDSFAQNREASLRRIKESTLLFSPLKANLLCLPPPLEFIPLNRDFWRQEHTPLLTALFRGGGSEKGASNIRVVHCLRLSTSHPKCVAQSGGHFLLHPPRTLGLPQPCDNSPTAFPRAWPCI